MSLLITYPAIAGSEENQLLPSGSGGKTIDFPGVGEGYL